MWRFATCLGVALALAAPALAFPPHRVVTVDPLRATIDGLPLHSTVVALADRWGDPAQSVPLGAGGAIYWWEGPTREGASATFCRSPLGRAVQIVYAGAYVTTRGDRPGTPLAAFRRRWPTARVTGSLVRVGAAAFTIRKSRLGTQVTLGRTGIALAGVLQNVC